MAAIGCEISFTQRFLPVAVDARILDVACGTGDLSLTLFEHGEARIIGIGLLPADA